MPLAYQLFQLRRVARIDFVDEQQHGNLLAVDAAQGELLNFMQKVGVLVRLLHGVCDVKQHIGILQSSFGKCEHRLLQFVVRLQNARGVGEDDLRLWLIDDAHDAMACGLRLEGGNADALAHEEIHER